MDRIDRILLAERELTPAADLGARIMEAVRREGESPPIPFPWKGFVLGFVGLPLGLLSALALAQLAAPAILASGAELLEHASGLGVQMLGGVAMLAASSLVILWSCALTRAD